MDLGLAITNAAFAGKNFGVINGETITTTTTNATKTRPAPKWHMPAFGVRIPVRHHYTIMKIAPFLAIIVCLSILAGYPASGQDTNKITISLNWVNVPADKALDVYKHSTKSELIIASDVSRATHGITLRAGAVSPEVAQQMIEQALLKQAGMYHMVSRLRPVSNGGRMNPPVIPAVQKFAAPARDTAPKCLPPPQAARRSGSDTSRGWFWRGFSYPCGLNLPPDLHRSQTAGLA